MPAASSRTISPKLEYNNKKTVNFQSIRVPFFFIIIIFIPKDIGWLVKAITEEIRCHVPSVAFALDPSFVLHTQSCDEHTRRRKRK